ncbi:MAG TPA: non-homologous end-joining DNA ligase [Flavitalea sp.]|nr:non-homologous end-joining DNA ligase [Flavitalea sp.]
MGLSGYKQKRSFNKTPEPKGGKSAHDDSIFVIQKHDASHLHYDFRLEMKGILKSWAVPKGPSTDPSVKHLAMMVEDHPYDYRNFEGIIPKGQYGGGTVIIWDQGTYLPAEGEFETKKERENNLLSQLHKGKIVITLKGEKLKGSFALVKSSYQGENSWLLMKVKDKYAKPTDVLKKDKSVISGKSISQMEKEPDKVYGKSRKKVSWTSVNNEDKKNKEVPAVKVKTTKSAKKGSRSAKKVTKVKKEVLLDPKLKQQVIKINGKELKFTNLDKIYWPKERIQKRAVLDYYHSIASYILPYIKDRPQSLNRYPNGIKGQSFYQKNIAGKFPGWIKTHDYKNTSKEGEKKFFVCFDEASLLYLANLGCIEINPWHSRVQNPGNPDFCIIDLDPDTNSFEQVIEAAQMVRQVLEAIKVPSYPKTSGSTGIHIYIPLGAAYDYDQSKMLAELVVTLVHRQIPSFTSLERTPAKRKGKIYLDFLQNRSIQTIAAPYSLRPKPGATVSMPLLWDEVKPGLSIADFDINNAFERIVSSADIFKPVLGKGINLAKILENLEKL